MAAADGRAPPSRGRPSRAEAAVGAACHRQARALPRIAVAGAVGAGVARPAGPEVARPAAAADMTEVLAAAARTRAAGPASAAGTAEGLAAAAGRAAAALAGLAAASIRRAGRRATAPHACARGPRARAPERTTSAPAAAPARAEPESATAWRECRRVAREPCDLLAVTPSANLSATVPTGTVYGPTAGALTDTPWRRAASYACA